MKTKKTLTGTSLVGDSVNRERVEEDYYATPKEATESLLNSLDLSECESFYEPACGEGHISKINIPTEKSGSLNPIKDLERIKELKSERQGCDSFKELGDIEKELKQIAEPYMNLKVGCRKNYCIESEHYVCGSYMDKLLCPRCKAIKEIKEIGEKS